MQRTVRVWRTLFCLAAAGLAQETPQQLVERADRHEKAHEYKQALSIYNELAAIFPKEAAFWVLRGGANFKMAKISESVADFDHAIQLNPRQAPELWQRGISLYYAGRYDEGRRQFETHQSVNPNDVENAVWRFLCMARAGKLAEARGSLLPIEHDARVPMMTIYDLYRGKAQSETVLAAAEAGTASAQERKVRRFYAHLYIGLHHEALGRKDQALTHIRMAAVQYPVDHYMHDVARVHLELSKTQR